MTEKPHEDFKKLSDEEISSSTVFSKPTIDTKIEKKKNVGIITKTIISAVLVIVLIIGTIIINKNLGKNDVTSSVSSNTSEALQGADATFSVISNDIEKIKSVEIENEYGTLSFYKKQVDENKFWYIDGVQEIITNTDSTYATISDCADVKALIKREYDEGFDYGFNEPTAKVRVKLEQNEYTFTVGKDWQNGSMTGAYLKVSGDENVYILPGTNVAYFTNDKKFYINTLVPTTIQKTDDNEEYFGTELDKFDYVELSGSKVEGGLLRFEMNSRESSTLLYKMTKPQEMLVNGDKVSDFVNMMREDIDATEILYYSGKEPTTAVLKNYKLDNPIATIKYKAGSDERVITLSQYEDGSKFYALKINTSPAIYEISHTVFEYLQNNVYEYASSAIIDDSITRSKSIVFDTDKKEYTFNLKTTKEKNEDGEETDVTSVSYGDKKIDFQNLSKFYTYILAIGPYVSENSILSERPDGTSKYFSVTITPDNKEKPITLSVYKLKNTSQRYYLELDGTPVGLCETRYADKAYENIENLISGKPLKEIG